MSSEARAEGRSLEGAVIREAEFPPHRTESVVRTRFEEAIRPLLPRCTYGSGSYEALRGVTVEVSCFDTYEVRITHTPESTTDGTAKETVVFSSDKTLRIHADPGPAGRSGTCGGFFAEPVDPGGDGRLRSFDALAERLEALQEAGAEPEPTSALITVLGHGPRAATPIL